MITFSKHYLILAVVLISASPVAADLVPFSIKSIKAAGSGFIELVGPGQLEIDGKYVDYKNTKYIAVSNIDSLTNVAGTSKACVISYSSDGYTENISVDEQSCKEIIQIIASAK